MQPNLNCLVQKVCLPLTRNSKVICQSTQGKIREEQGGAWRYLRNVITYWGPTPWNDIAVLVSDKRTLELMEKHFNNSHYGYKREYVPNRVMLEQVKSCLFKHG